MTIKPAWMLTILTVGCMATASPEAAKVRLTSNPEAVKGCKFIGNVQADSGWNGSATSNNLGANEAEVIVREKTVKLGGNVAFIVVGSGGPHMTGEAYSCPTTP